MGYEIAILLPIFAAEKTLKRSLDSIYGQIELPDELEKINLYLIYNGLEKDENLDHKKYEEITSCFSSDRIKQIHMFVAEKGIVPALNHGLFNAIQNEKCKYIFRQDSDDFWYEQKVSKQLAFLEQNPNVHILGTSIRFVELQNDQVILKERILYPEKDAEIKQFLLAGSNAFAHPSVAVRKEVFYRAGGYDDLYPFAEDLSLWLKCVKWFTFHNLQEVLMEYTRTTNSNYNPLSPIIAASNAMIALRYFGDPG